MCRVVLISKSIGDLARVLEPRNAYLPQVNIYSPWFHMSMDSVLQMERLRLRSRLCLPLRCCINITMHLTMAGSFLLSAERCCLGTGCNGAGPELSEKRWWWLHYSIFES